MENLTQISFDVTFIIIYSLPSLLVLLKSQFQVAVTYCYFRSPDTVTSRILVLVEVEVFEAKVRGTEDNLRMSHAAVLRSLSQQLLRNNKVGALSFMFFSDHILHIYCFSLTGTLCQWLVRNRSRCSSAVLLLHFPRCLYFACFVMFDTEKVGKQKCA